MNQLTLGDVGVGTMTIRDGADVTAGTTALGNSSANSFGSMTVTERIVVYGKRL